MHCCGDDNTCGKHGKLIAEFRSTCMPNGWTSVPYSICEALKCIELTVVECQDSSTCVPIFDSNDVYHECGRRDRCGDAPVCGESDGVREEFPLGCLPSGWEPVSSSECAQDASD